MRISGESWKWSCRGIFRSTQEKEEEEYMLLDDTVDIGQKPLPIVTEQDKAYAERCKAFLRACCKEK